jgi:hypothetical protein
MEAFRKGQNVAVCNPAVRAPSIGQVVRVTSRFVELDDGSRWQPDGSKPYPSPSGPVSRYIRAVTQRDHLLAMAENTRVKLILGRYDAWEYLTYDEVLFLHEITLKVEERMRKKGAHGHNTPYPAEGGKKGL